MIPQAVATNGLASLSPPASMASMGYLSVGAIAPIIYITRDHVLVEYHVIGDVVVAMRELRGTTVDFGELPVYAVGIEEIGRMGVDFHAVRPVDVSMSELATMLCAAGFVEIGSVDITCEERTPTDVAVDEVGAVDVVLEDTEEIDADFMECGVIDIAFEELS